MSTIVCYCNHEESDHDKGFKYCNQPDCDCLEFDKRGRRRLEGVEWSDGAGNIWTEKWVMLILDRDTVAQRGPEIRAHGPVVGTEEQAKEMLQQAAASWGQRRRLGVARIIEPEIVQHEATITW